MNASTPLVADRAVVRTFVERIHSHAAAAFEGVHQPGMMQLVRIHPGTEDTLAFRFAIGEVDLMADEAVRQSNAGNNVYIEGRTVAKGASKRGSLADTIGVFAFVNDADADKGRAGHLAVQPSLVVETSPGNAHHWLLLDRALPMEQAKGLGAAIRAKAGADSATGVLTQPYRVAGTPNFPGKLKLARGRVATQTRIIDLDGPTWSADALKAEFPEPEKPKRAAGPRPEGTSGRTSATAEAIAAELGDGDRSARFHAAVVAAFADGLTVDDLDEIMRRHPDGCGGKYLEPYDRLRREIERSWEKVEARAEERQRAAERPAYEDASSPVDHARRAVAIAVQRFVDAATVHRVTGDDEAEPPVHALAVTTGVGKTSVSAKTIAGHILSRRGTIQATKGVLYAVPTHRLGSEIERQFLDHGVTARVFRGRQAPDPDRPGQAMCDDVEAVEIALALGEPVEAACCRHKPKGKPEQTCQHFATCAYQAQKKRKPDVWIVAHQMLFKAQPALGDIEMVVIDEGFWQSGVRIPKRGLTLDEIRAQLPLGRAREDALQNDIEHFRGQLARALIAQDGSDGPGGVRREHLLRVGLTGEVCTNAITAEWRLKEQATIFPGMPKADRRRAAEAARHAKHVRAYTSMWGAARGILYDEGIEVSGHLYIERRDEDDEGHVLVVKARGLKAIAKAWRVPTLILDATLPAPDILKAFFPQVETPEAVEAAMPHVRVRQVLGAPVAAHRLRIADGESAGRNLRAIRREILRRFVELDRAPVLVIAQKAAADWLRASGLPEGVAVEHFNNVAGLDRYRDVRGLMVIGRTIPAPVAVEALAGALTGREPTTLPKGQWYGKAVRGLRTRDGKPVGVECDAHPDPVAEACRWQICEGELMQALGRARGVNRTAGSPLAIDVLANVCLPVTVDEVANWSPPSEAVEMVADGVVLDSAADMAAAWPGVWPSDGAARVWLHRHTGGEGSTVTDPYITLFYKGVCNGALRFRYQRAGRAQKWRTGAYDPAAVPDLKVWLETRLGPLTGFSIDPDEPAPPADAAPQAGASGEAEPAPATVFRCVVDIPVHVAPLAPSHAEVIRFDLADSGAIRARLAARLRSIRPAPLQDEDLSCPAPPSRPAGSSFTLAASTA